MLPLACKRSCVLAVIVSASAEGLNGSIDAPSDCCGSVTGGMCANGKAGTPCCGVGTCNIFCCNCDGGCIKAPPPPPPTPPIPPSAASTPLNQWPMITTHDAATSYYSSETCTPVHAVANYVMTQVPGTFAKQLDCGARAFDVRVHQDGSKLVMHHGDVVIDHAVSDALNEVVQWAGRNPNELVIMLGSHCSGGDNCQQMWSDALASAKIQRIECSEIAALTLGTALKRGRLPNGGSVLGTWGCNEENYVPSITCYGEIGEDDARLEDGPSQRQNVTPPVGSRDPRLVLWTCYGSDAARAFDPLWAYMSTTCDGRGKKQNNLWMAQAHWQYDTSSIAQGEVMLSCILKDESKAGVNKKLAQKITEGSFPHINLLEVDDVCGGHGPEILTAIRGRFTYDIDVMESKVIV